jgi:hypothetical protein
MGKHSKQKYWMVVDEDNTIMGIGETRAKAIEDGKSIIALLQRERSLSKPIRCSESLYGYVVDNIVTIHDTWTMVAGVAELDCHVNTRENINEMRELIDDIYKYLPFLCEEKEPAKLEEWKNNWMSKARKHKKN